MSWLNKLNAPFPFYLNDDRRNTFFVLVLSLFVVFFLHTYRPYGFHTELTLAQKFLYGGITFAVFFMDIILLPKVFPRSFDPLRWTIGKYILLTLLHLFLIGVVSTLINIFFIHPEKAAWECIISVNREVAIIGIIPVSITFLFLKNTMLQQNLGNALVANRELEKIKNLKKEIAAKVSSNHLLTIYSDTSETLSLHLPDLLFIEADDNYSTIYWKSSETIEKKLLRVNLKSIEGQINNSFAIRCHRSYIVNVNAISNITGNTNGYKLQILDTDFFIPVSRPKGKEVIEKIHQLRNVMELA